MAVFAPGFSDYSQSHLAIDLTGIEGEAVLEAVFVLFCFYLSSGVQPLSAEGLYQERIEAARWVSLRGSSLKSGGNLVFCELGEGWELQVNGNRG